LFPCVLVEKEPSRGSAVLRSFLALVPKIALFVVYGPVYGWILNWNDPALLFMLIVPALAVFMGVFWDHRLRAPGYQQSKAIELAHQKLVQTMSSLLWIITNQEPRRKRLRKT